jgi:predicted N-acetyltransferase YhbS
VHSRRDCSCELPSFGRRVGSRAPSEIEKPAIGGLFIASIRGALQVDALPLSLVARSDEGQPLGAASLLASTVTQRHLRPWLSSVVVPAVHRGHGIASALSLRALKEARPTSEGA